jgi:hypothetical protein
MTVLITVHIKNVSYWICRSAYISSSHKISEANNDGSLVIAKKLRATHRFLVVTTLFLHFIERWPLQKLHFIKDLLPYKTAECYSGTAPISEVHMAAGMKWKKSTMMEVASSGKMFILSFMKIH